MGRTARPAAGPAAAERAAADIGGFSVGGIAAGGWACLPSRTRYCFCRYCVVCTVRTAAFRLQGCAATPVASAPSRRWEVGWEVGWSMRLERAEAAAEASDERRVRRECREGGSEGGGGGAARPVRPSSSRRLDSESADAAAKAAAEAS